jgi:hypothetical protein
MPDKTNRSGVGQAWLAPQVGMTVGEHLCKFPDRASISLIYRQ